MTSRDVLVLNHFAVPRGYPGGTRHVELFGRLLDWNSRIVASRLNLTTGEAQECQDGFVFVPVIRYGSNGAMRILNWWSYAAMATLVGLGQRKLDVVYASSPHLLTGLAGWLIAAVRRKPLILEVRDLWPQVLVDMGKLAPTSTVYRSLEALERFLYKRSTAIVVLVSGTRNYLEDRGVPSEKIYDIPNAADPEDFLPSATRDALRARYGFDKITAVYAGAHGPANGLNLLLDAAEGLLDLDVDIILVGDGVEKQMLMAASKRRNLKNVRFLDPIPKTEMADILAAADIGLHVLADVPLFRYGVSPNKVFDCMAAGLPVATNSLGVVGDAVTGAGSGVAVPSNGLGAAIRQLATSPTEILAEYRASGLRWSKENSRSEMTRRLSLLLMTTAESSSPRSEHLNVEASV